MPLFFHPRFRLSLLALVAVVVSLQALQPAPSSQPPAARFPYREMGLTDQQAAAHLLNRFSFGPRPGEVDAVVKMGLENWFEQQLTAGLPDPTVQEKLQGYDVLSMTNQQIVDAFPKPLQVARLAKAAGYIKDDSLQVRDEKKYKEQVRAFAVEKNFRRQTELYRQFINAKIIRSAYSTNQLKEVMTDFWFNHFNVSLTKRSCALFVPNYERDAIRPYALGSFEQLLLATAKSPAMLIYLDNFTSAGKNDDFDDDRVARKLEKAKERLADGDSTARQQIQRLQKAQQNKGLNENYAREVMELHTLGVDGGYTQSDVTEAARVLTGWTMYPLEDGPGTQYRNMIKRFGEENLIRQGFVHEGDFFFAINRHDNRPKTVMGKRFDGKGGYQEGVELLRMLAHHASTARFICKKLAVRFVSDEPPASLVDKMASAFMQSGGDIKTVLRSMVNAPEFWSKEVLRAKTKSPYELIVSAVRALEAELDVPFQVYQIANRMGQQLYHYAPPTGFPDRAQYWINSGALLNRMNFGMAIAAQQIRGIRCDLLALNQHHEPESSADALQVYSQLLLPQRDLTNTIKRLTPMLTKPELANRLEKASGETNKQKESDAKESDMEEDALADWLMDEPTGTGKRKEYGGVSTQAMLAQVVGIILGSPEFQRK